jgi:uridine kinase
VSVHDPRSVADLLVRRARALPARLGRTRLLCVDGPAGAGKTTLAAALAEAAAEHGSAAVLHMDDMYEGWSGLRDSLPRVEAQVVEPLRHGRAGRYHRYDWHAGAFAECHEVPPVDVLVLEGVGSGATAWADDTTLLVWVEAPHDLRLRRGLERDGEAVRAEWLAWMQAEEALHAEEHTRARADVVVDGTGVEPPATVHTGGSTRM